MKKKSLERSCKGVKRWKDMIWKKWIKCDIIVKSYMKSMNIYSKYMDLNFGIVTFLVFEPMIREILSFDEIKSWFNQIWDILKCSNFSLGRRSNFKKSTMYEVDEIDKSKTDYLQLFILSTGCQRQKIKRYVIAHFLVNFDGFIT